MRYLTLLIIALLVSCNVTDTTPEVELEPTELIATLEWSFVDMDTRIYVEDIMIQRDVLSSGDTLRFEATKGDTVSYKLNPTQDKLADGTFKIGTDSIGIKSHYYLFDYGKTFTVEGGFIFNHN